MPLPETVIPEFPINPQIPPVADADHNIPVTPEDEKKIIAANEELSQFLQPVEVQPSPVDHEGERILEGKTSSTHAFRIEGDTVVIEESPGEFKSDLKADPVETRRWWAVWVEHLAKVKHLIMRFVGKTPN